MSFKVKVPESNYKVYNSAIATKILDLMDKLRKEATSSSKRRWIWELLQNAKDVGFEDKSVSVEINFDKQNSFVEFKHNGKPFTVDNLTFLIQQVSTKERSINEGEKPKTTGKFGTGFLTTHLLSEKVDLISIVEEPELEFREFRILLDRSGKTIQEITDSINQSISVLEDLDNDPAFDKWNPNAFNTIFKYNLDSVGVEVAEIGIADLRISLPFTLAFLPKINSVSVPHENIIYELESIEELNKDIKIIKISEKGSDFQKSIEIVVLENENVSISIEIERIDDKIYIKELDKLMPRLFCDFPLIGSEDFYFPVIVNSSLFNPNDPRDGIWLNIPDRVDKDTEYNKELMKEALTLYFSLLDFASENDWQNMFHLVAIKKPNEKNWISEKWFEDELLKPARAKILKTPIVDTAQGERVAVKNQENEPNIWFPSSSKPEVIERIWDLANSWCPANIPRKSDIHSWYKVLWSDFSKLDLNLISFSIQSSENIAGIAKMLSQEEGEAITWLNSYFDLINFEETFIKEITSDKYSIIPNQNGIFKKKTELSGDKDIEEELKNVLQILGMDIRESLKHKEIVLESAYKKDTNELIIISPKTQDEIIDLINKILKENKDKDAIFNACFHLINCFSDEESFPQKRNKVYEFSKIYKQYVQERKTLQKWSNNIWEEVDKLLIKWLVTTIADQKTITTLSNILELTNENDTIEWLKSFITFLTEEGYDLKTAPILPNQKGVFKIKDDLFLDNGEIDEELKNISANLGYDFRDELLYKDIFLVLPPNQVRTQEQVAGKIAKMVKPLFGEFSRSQETKQIFKALFLWFNNNKATSEEIFEELFKNKHKLYDDDEIADNMQKAETLNEIMEEYGINNENELRERLKATPNNQLVPFGNFDSTSEKEESIWKEIALFFIDSLKNIGISDFEEYLKFLSQIKEGKILIRSDERKSEFRPKTELASENVQVDSKDYVEKITIEAIEKALPYLMEQGYEFIKRNIEHINIFEVKKEGKNFDLIVRPSHGKRYQLYQNERVLIQNKETELWLSNGFEVKKESLYAITSRMSTFIPTDSFLPGYKLM